MAIGDKKSAVMQSDIVNDFTTGGAKNVLSAEMGKTLAQRPNPNLLDNWYFADPIDQRGGQVVPSGATYYTGWNTGAPVVAGTTEKYYAVLTNDGSWTTISIDSVTYGVPASSIIRGYTGSSYGYAIDRWKAFTVDVPLELTDSGIKIAPTSGNFVIDQLWETPLIIGQKYTASYLTNNGLQKYTFTFNGAQLSSGRIFIRSSGKGIQFWFSTSNQTGVTLKAAKLELGSTQTLAHQDADGNWVLNEIPDKGIELLKCISSTADTSDTYANTGFVKKTGDIMTGPLEFPNANTGRRAIIKTTPGFPTALMNAADDDNYCAIRLGPETDPLSTILRLHTVIEDAGTWYNIHHTGNKPSGSYTGNGDATLRTIAVGGIGNCVVVWSIVGYAFINPSGAVAVYANQLSAPNSTEVNFNDGILALITTNGALNENGITYYYQVL